MTSHLGAVVSPWTTDLYRAYATPLAEVVGEPTAKALAKLGLDNLGDLLYHVPRRFVTGAQTTDLATITPGDDVAVIADIYRMQVAGRDPRRPRLELVLTDGTGYLDVTFFGRPHLISFWQKQLSAADRGIFVGSVGTYRGRPQMTHPTFILFDANGNFSGSAERERIASHVDTSGLVGIYPASSKITTWQIADCVDLALDWIRSVPDPMSETIRDTQGLMSITEAFDKAHNPPTVDDSDAAKRRLVFDEALALQVTMARRRQKNARDSALQIRPRADGVLAAFDASLPFRLTDGQNQVSDEIFADLASSSPMQRLLQGEVGSGKTVVALRAMLAAVDAGHQACLMAPTEVLAGQHEASIREMLGDLASEGLFASADHPVSVRLLTGSMTAAEKKQVRAEIASGLVDIVVGTHALLSDTTVFANLALVVVDEQHRFGVEQRGVLQGKAEQTPHTLVLTATPIPRSIAMTMFGDLATSTLRELPAGRQKIQTTVIEAARNPRWLDRAWERIREEVAAGHQAFVVCPAIEPSETMTSVTHLADELRAGPLAQLNVGTLHGALSADEKDSTMRAFAAGEISVLISTTVIEVGVDVPNATVMVIMDADRFGISQLHQLRGRVGRGTNPGLCLLVTNASDDADSLERLASVASTMDGFALAEADLRHRREGNLLGAQQSGGASALRMLRATDHMDVIAAARGLADELVAADPEEHDAWLADLVRFINQRSSADWIGSG